MKQPRHARGICSALGLGLLKAHTFKDQIERTIHIRISIHSN